MPRNTKDLYKRRAAQAVNHMMAATIDMEDLRKVFENGHPELVTQMETIMTGQAAVIEHLLKLVYETWGIDADTLAGYMG